MLRSRHLWIVLFSACFVLGLAGVWRALVWRVPRFNDREASLREMATQHLGIPDGLEQIRALLTPLPKDAAVIFFGSTQEWESTEMFLLTSDLAWPRPVWFVAINSKGAKPAVPPPAAVAASASALAFFDVQPPFALTAKARRVGSRFSFILNPESAP
jgi:hypothetical protein